MLSQVLLRTGVSGGSCLPDVTTDKMELLTETIVSLKSSQIRCFSSVISSSVELNSKMSTTGKYNIHIEKALTINAQVDK